MRTGEREREREKERGDFRRESHHPTFKVSAYPVDERKLRKKHEIGVVERLSATDKIPSKFYNSFSTFLSSLWTEKIN